MTNPTIVPHRSVNQTPEQQLMMARIFWVAMIFSHVIFAFVGLQVILPSGLIDSALEAVSMQPTLMSALSDPTGQAIAGLAGMLLIVSFVVPKVLGGKAAPFQRTVVGFALNESVAFLGLGGGFGMLRNREFGLSLIGLSLFFILVRFPTKANMGLDATNAPVRGIREG